LADTEDAAGTFRTKLDRYRVLFDSMDEGFCIIEFLDGPHCRSRSRCTQQVCGIVTKSNSPR